MKSVTLSMVVTAALTMSLAAQTDPVGQWIVRPYGQELNETTPHLLVQACVSGDQLWMTVYNSQAGGQISGLMAASPAQEPIPGFPGATLLVPTTSEAFPLQLDGSGTATFQLELGLLDTNLLYMQFVEFGSNGIALSNGYEIKLHQSGEFGYSGPEVESLIIVSEGVTVQYQLMLDFAVPTAGWQARVDSVDRKLGKTDVRVTLEDPGAGAPAAQAPLQVFITLPSNMGYAVDVLIDEIAMGTDPAPNHQRADIIPTLCFESPEPNGQGEETQVVAGGGGRVGVSATFTRVGVQPGSLEIQ